MTTLIATGATADARVAETIRRFWGFDALRPLQAEAIAAALEHRDSLVVMPTGGGKSLCYQVPPLVEESATVVVSPLLSLIKDQVDGLREAGVAATALHGSMDFAEQREAERELLNGRVRILFTTPERALSRNMVGLLRQAGVRAVAIDEAHCISHWGHDFRPEYRRLRELRDALPDVVFHAFTATATQRVRDDIIAELGLRDPAVLVGSFDRPNLVYRVLPRRDEYRQVVDVLNRHKGEAAIIYCITRRETESLAAALTADGFNAAAYHAGLAPDVRRRTQDAFARETLDIVVATVAFGMGIDRSNVRCVIHAAMPKSIEHYQQEAGRAGRDGLPAECVLLYSPADAIRWESMLSRPQDEAPPGEAPSSGASSAGNGSAAGFAAAAVELLGHMRTFCCAPGCRHRRLVEYFGQAFDRDNCGACDTCLGEIEVGDDERVVAQKILSCVARVKERFGVGHVVDVLTGASTARIAQFEHDKLSTYGLLRELGKPSVTSLVNQLLDQGLLARRAMEVKGMTVSVLALNDASWEVLRNQRPVHFRKDAEPVHETASEAASWEGVDRELFDALRELRRRLAEERGVAPFVLFHDSTLRSLARVRPSTLAALGAMRGIGERKREDLGGPVLEVISRHVRERSLTADQPDLAPPPAGPRKASTSDLAAAALFAKGASVAEVCTQMGRAQSTVYGYLEQYILRSKPARIDAWVDDTSYAAIAAALEKDASGLLRPVFEALGGTYSYEQIRIVGAHRRALAGS